MSVEQAYDKAISASVETLIQRCTGLVIAHQAGQITTKDLLEGVADAMEAVLPDDPTDGPKT